MWILIHIPYLLLWGIIIALVVLLCIRRRRKRRKNPEGRLWKPASVSAGTNAAGEPRTEQEKGRARALERSERGFSSPNLNRNVIQK